MFDPGDAMASRTIALDETGMMNNLRMNVHSQAGWT
jgi:hypothetical protein